MTTQERKGPGAEETQILATGDPGRTQAVRTGARPLAAGEGDPLDPPTTAIPIIDRPGPPPAPAEADPGRERRRRLLERWLAPALAVLAIAMLPIAARTTDLSKLDGWGLAKILSPFGWLALLLAIAACLTEFTSRKPRVPMLGAATGVLVFCSTGIPSAVEPVARFATAWTITGFVDAMVQTNGVPPDGIDARFSWPAFFAQWAWFREAAGAPNLDVVLRWFPPVVVIFWAIGIYALARSMLGGTRAPWVAAWLFIGLNWIEQDYFSPQAIGICILLTVLTFALGPLATRRTDDMGAPGWPVPHAGARRLPLLQRWRAAAMTPPNRPTLPPRQVLLVYFCAALCIIAIVPTHQLTPFAIVGQLALLAVVGRFRGRGLVILGTVAIIVFILIAARTFWTTQLDIITGGGNTVAAGIANRVTGDTGQVVVKQMRVVVPLLTYLLGAIGAIVYYKRRRDLVPIGLALVPMAFAVQGYGGEAFLRIFLFGLPILTILGADALRRLARSKPKTKPLLAACMVILFGVMVLMRGGNDAYQNVSQQEIDMYRSVIATTPKGTDIVPLGNAGPFGFEGLLDFGRGKTSDQCKQFTDDPVLCATQTQPGVIIDFESIEKQGVVLNNKPPGWSLELVNQLVATGQYTIWFQDGYNVVLRRVPGV